MDSKERREIIRLNGTMMVVILALIANSLIVGLIYRWHNWQVFAEEKITEVEYAKVLKQSHNLKQEIIAKEGVSTWASTSFQMIHDLK